jgi:type I restriction enzyme M protein
MALKKSQLYSSIWQACDELRGGMDASQYKDYVLVLLFVRYVSDKYSGKSDSIVDIPKGGSFTDFVALKGKKNIGEGINGVLDVLAEANGLSGVINSVDFDDEEKLGKGKAKQERLSKLVAIFENPDLDFSKNKADGDDLLGDAYEYLIKHFAVQSGKSKGSFYTPAEVSRIMAKVIGAEHAKDRTQTVYDPTCGSGSLLLKVAAEAKPVDISIYGQEKDTPTATLAILNMWLHSEPTAVIKKGQSTLSNPLFTESSALKTFDYVVANPPFSYKAWRNGFTPEEDPYSRFDGFGIPPNKNGDYAFLLHIIKSLKSTGKGAVVLPHGVLFRGNTEADIRINLIKRGYIKGIIGLPANLFYGTGIPACIVIVDKKKPQDRDGIFIIDASKGLIKDGNKNRLREQDIRKIIDVWDKQEEVEKFSHFATNKEIEKNEYNLNLPRYIDTSEPENVQSIEAHLKGGIPKHDIDLLENYWAICPSLRKSLFKNSSRSGYYDVAVKKEEVRSTILEHDEFLTFKKSVQTTLNNWRKKKTIYLKGLDKDTPPKSIVKQLASSLLDAYKNIELLDKYDIYQHLMAYWEEIMQDDVYIVTADGWQAGNEWLRNYTKIKSGKNKGNKKEVKGLVGLEGRLISTSLLIRTYLQEEQSELDRLQSELEQVDAEMVELEEEHTGEEGILEEAKSEAGNVTLTNVKNLVKEYKENPDFKEELKILNGYLDLNSKEKIIKKKIKEAEKKLEQKIIAKYPTLGIEGIKNLVVERKWMDALDNSVMSEVDRLSQTLAGRVEELAERYEETLPKIVQETEKLTKKVNGHLIKMGFKV